MFVHYIENFLTKKKCELIIDFANSFQLIQMKSSKFINGKLLDENIEYDGNKRSGCYFMNESLELPLFKELSENIIKLSNDINPYKGIEYNEINKFSFNSYSKGDFLEWHSDKHEILSGATLTYILQLNDDYENGEIKYIINDTEYIVKKKVGSIFVFDSNILHSVAEVTKGNRYSINVWPSKSIKKSLL